MDPRLPREAYVPNIGRVRVLSYQGKGRDGKGRFMVLDSRDVVRYYPRERLTFLRSSRGPSPS